MSKQSKSSNSSLLEAEIETRRQQYYHLVAQYHRYHKGLKTNCITDDEKVELKSLVVEILSSLNQLRSLSNKAHKASYKHSYDKLIEHVDKQLERFEMLILAVMLTS